MTRAARGHRSSALKGALGLHNRGHGRPGEVRVAAWQGDPRGSGPAVGVSVSSREVRERRGERRRL